MGDELSVAFVAGVKRPSEVLHQMNTKEFGALDDVHRGAINIQQRVDVVCSSKFNNHLL